jgi:glycosyltransferase involved in cell wall biosynthesis
MVVLSSGLILLLLTMAVLNISWGRRFARMMRDMPPEISSENLPPAAVIVSLRGADPFLTECLAGLADQDYPDYQVTIVIDHEEDPCATVVKDFLERRSCGRFNVLYLDDPLKTCSLKVSALIQAIDQLDARFELVMSIDADAVAPPDWLRAMAAPLTADPGLAATTGIRWFVPVDRKLPNLIRRQWNIGAVVQMHQFDIPWGGSLGIRRSFFDEADLFRHWSQCLCEDTPLAAALVRHQRAIRFVPEAVMLNREATTLPEVFRFINRQILFTQLYHPRWFAVQLPGVINGFLPLTSLIMGVVLIALGNPLGWALAVAGAALSASLILQAKLASWAVRKSLSRKGVELRRSPFNAMTLFSSQCAILAQMWAVIRPVFIRTIEWRGITYRRTRGKQFELVEYVPYQPKTNDLDRSELSI